MKTFTIISYLAAGSSAITAVSTDLFNQIKSYAGLSAAATIAFPCTTPPNQYLVETSFSTGPTWTNVSATVFRKDSTREYVLTFAASNNSRNAQLNGQTDLVGLNGNFPCGNATATCKIHEGFQISYGAATDSRDLAYMVRNVVASITRKRPGYSLSIAGASLGGALASQAFLDLSSQNYPIAGVWTYGEPRVGNQFLVELVENKAGSNYNTAGKYHRVTHANDLVVQIPTPFGNGTDLYTHSLTEFWHSQKECETTNTAATTFRCFGREDSNCANKFGFSDLKPHSTYPGYREVSCANRPVPDPCTA